MGRSYRQLSLEDRCSIARLHEAGQSKRQIAAALGRSPSTIAREMKRNQGSTVGYRPAYAADRAWARRWRGSRLERQPELRDQVLERLSQGHSPEQVAGRLALERQGRKTISAESIYRFVYAQIRRTDDTRWRFFLPRAKYKRGYRRPRRDHSPMRLIPHRVPLAHRPQSVQDRSGYGHWEADLMLFSRPGNLLLVAQERVSRLLLATRLPGKAARPIARQLLSDFQTLPPPLRQSVTFDNGAEFTHHHQLAALDMKTYFCDRHAPWQKGGIENAIGRLRRALPRTTDLRKLPQKDIHRLAARYNHTPRKCLGFHTPAELFTLQLLHFNCESTPSLRSG